MNFERFISDIRENHWNVYGVEVYENGILTHSYGDTCDGSYDIYSATKTVLSIAVGIAYDRGLLDLQKSILAYLPEEKVKALSEKQRATFQKLTLHRLLTMSVDDFPFRPEGDRYLDFALACEIIDPEKIVFHYNNINAFLVGVALQSVLEEDLGDFIVNNILEPLHITKYKYGRTPEGYFYGASKMKLTVNGLSQIGLLLYNKGKYEGQQIVSEKYIRMATSIQQMNREGGYGYFIWKYKDGFSINGKWKQKCYCLPERGLMITFLAHIKEPLRELQDSMERYIIEITE